MKTPERFNLCVCVCACVCVCVCVCGCLSVCLFLYSFTVKTSSVCKVSETCLWGMDQQSCLWVSYQVLLPSSLVSISFFTSKDEIPARRLLEIKRYDIWFHKKLIYIDIGICGPLSKPTSDEKILKIRRLLLSVFFHFELSP